MTAYLTPAEVAAVLRCSTKTVRRLTDAGALVGFRPRGMRSRLYGADDVKQFVEQPNRRTK